MTIYARFCLQAVVVVCLATLTACSGHAPNYQPCAGKDNQTLQEEESSPTVDELSYLTMESEPSLTEELQELDKTGSWDAPAAGKSAGEITYDFPVIVNKQVQFYINQFQGRQRKTFAHWLARSKQYQTFIEGELEKAGLPKDLVFLAMIESGYNPTAYSRAHAAGLWQFIPGTGKLYGLRINKWVDERREPNKATLAAIKYLSCLYDEFGDWYLAVAAYNAGEGRIGKAIRKYNTKDFWEIASHNHLSLETKRYVPKLLAAIIVGRNPEKYGFNDIEYKKPQKYDLITIPPGTDLEAIAVSASTTVKKLRTLNTELRKNQTPPGNESYAMRIPHGTHNLVAKNLKRLHPVVTTDYTTHTVYSGDTLSSICRKYRINKTTLLKANKLRTASLKKGQRLRIPYRATKYILLKKGETPESRFAKAGREGQMLLHELKPGETLSGLAKKYDVPVRIIQQWNNIRNVKKIRAGDHIALYLSNSSPVAPQVQMAESASPESQVADLSQAIIVLQGSKKKNPHSSEKNSDDILPDTAVQLVYQVQNGDSLWTIAKKFQVSASQIREWNNLGNNMIHPGTKLVIKKG